MTKTNKIIYWIATILVSLGMLSGGIFQLMHAPQTVEGTKHIGYPEYLLTLLGIWKILAVITLLVPKFPLVKEWAYAGIFFLLTGALYSHLCSGDTLIQSSGLIVLIVLLVLSWYFRPAERKINTTNQ